MSTTTTTTTNRMLSRKFIVSLLIVLCTTGLASYDKLSAEDTKLIFAMVGCGYGLANVFSKTIDANNDNTTTT